MSNLDDKLKQIRVPTKVRYEVGVPPTPESWVNLSPKAIEQIKQAFADEGFVQTKKWAETGFEGLVLSGKEWYDRFERIANDFPSYEPIKSPRLLALDMARRAAGLK